MTKITQNTELKAGMKVKINNEIFMIIERKSTNELAFINENFELMRAVVSDYGYKNLVWWNKNGQIINILIENNVELIEDNAKVVVSEYIAIKLEKAKRDSIEIENGKFKVHPFAWKLLGSLSVLDVREEELSLQKIVKICEDTTIFKNGWEVEKPKKWYRVYITTAGNAIVAEDEDIQSTPRDSHISNGNSFKTHEEAQDVADGINFILRGER